jgi:hypothetical protein
MVRAPKPVTAVNRMSWTRKQLALITATVAFASAVACLSLVSTQASPNSSLGADWQCSRTALIMTTCTRIRHTESEPAIQNAKPVIHGSRKDPICLRQA